MNSIYFIELLQGLNEIICGKNTLLLLWVFTFVIITTTNAQQMCKYLTMSDTGIGSEIQQHQCIRCSRSLMSWNLVSIYSSCKRSHSLQRKQQRELWKTDIFQACALHRKGQLQLHSLLKLPSSIWQHVDTFFFNHPCHGPLPQHSTYPLILP